MIISDLARHRGRKLSFSPCKSTSLKIRDYVLQPHTISGKTASNITVLLITYYCIANSIYSVQKQFYKQQLVSTRLFRHVARTRDSIAGKDCKKFKWKKHIQIKSGSKINYNNYYVFFLQSSSHTSFLNIFLFFTDMKSRDTWREVIGIFPACVA